MLFILSIYILQYMSYHAQARYSLSPTTIDETLPEVILKYYFLKLTSSIVLKMVLTLSYKWSLPNQKKLALKNLISIVMKMFSHMISELIILFVFIICGTIINNFNAFIWNSCWISNYNEGTLIYLQYYNISFKCI